MFLGHRRLSCNSCQLVGAVTYDTIKPYTLKPFELRPLASSIHSLTHWRSCGLAHVEDIVGGISDHVPRADNIVQKHETRYNKNDPGSEQQQCLAGFVELLLLQGSRRDRSYWTRRERHAKAR